MNPYSTILLLLVLGLTSSLFSKEEFNLTLIEEVFNSYQTPSSVYNERIDKLKASRGWSEAYVRSALESFILELSDWEKLPRMYQGHSRGRYGGAFSSAIIVYYQRYNDSYRPFFKRCLDTEHPELVSKVIYFLARYHLQDHIEMVTDYYRNGDMTIGVLHLNILDVFHDQWDPLPSDQKRMILSAVNERYGESKFKSVLIREDKFLLKADPEYRHSKRRKQMLTRVLERNHFPGDGAEKRKQYFQEQLNALE